MMGELNDTVARILRRWWVVVIITGLVVAIVAWQVATAPEQYRSSMAFVVAPSSELDQAEAFRVSDILRNRVTIGTYANVLESPLVVEQAMDNIQLPHSQRSDYRIRIITEPESNAFWIRAEGPDPATTVALVQSVHRTGADVLASIFPIFELTLISGNSVSASPASTTPDTVIPIGFAVGLGFGALAALWVDSLLLSRRPSAQQRAVAGTALAPSTHPASASPTNPGTEKI